MPEPTPRTAHRLRHAVLGVGGVGGLLAVLLARTGVAVTTILRQQSLASYGGEIALSSQVYGSFAVAVPACGRLEQPIDVLWVAPKATHLEDFLALAAPDTVGNAVVVPLLNGIDHVEVLRARYQRVLPAALRGEVERLPGMRIEHRGSLLRVDLPATDLTRPIADVLIRAGITCAVAGDETTILWSKLCFLAPLALVTTASNRPLGAALRDAEFARLFQQARRETVTLARIAGAEIDEKALDATFQQLPPEFTSSMHKDFRNHRPIELDAVSGPLIRLARQHRIRAPAIEKLVRMIRATDRSRSGNSFVPPSGI